MKIRCICKQEIDFKNKRMSRKLSRMLRNKSKHRVASMEPIIIEKYEVPYENMNAEFKSKVQTPYLQMCLNQIQKQNRDLKRENRQLINDIEGLNEGFLRYRFSMISKGMIEPPK
jgi:hypothetical protein